MFMAALAAQAGLTDVITYIIDHYLLTHKAATPSAVTRQHEVGGISRTYNVYVGPLHIFVQLQYEHEHALWHDDQAQVCAM